MDIITEGKLKAGMEFIKLARQYGAKLVRSKKHNVFRDAAGHQITAPKTTSDFRAIKNFEAELRGRGFIKQETVKKVKDSLVNKSKETVLKPATKTPVSRQTTFSDFTRKYQPNVQGPRRSELEVQADNIIRSLRSKPARKIISKAELDGMNIPQKQKDALIKQGLVESKYKVAAQLMRKAGVRNYDDLTRVVNTIKQQVGDKIIQGIRKPKQPTQKGLELQRRMSRAVDKNKNKYPGLFDEQLAQEQMVVPRSIKKKNPLMTVKTEMDILKQLSNRKAAYDRARTGKPMYPFSEDNKHRDDKLNYQYKEVTNPKKPVDPIRALKLKKV